VTKRSYVLPIKFSQSDKRVIIFPNGARTNAEEIKKLLSPQYGVFKLKEIPFGQIIKYKAPVFLGTQSQSNEFQERGGVIMIFEFKT
jgi:hypothetical protein